MEKFDSIKLLEEMKMRRFVIVVSLFSSSLLWADWFCGTLDLDKDQITVKQEYLELIKNYCDNVIIDGSGKCHLIEFTQDGEAFIKENHEDGVRSLCVGEESCQNNNVQNDDSEEPSWFIKALIEFGQTSASWRR